MKKSILAIAALTWIFMANSAFATNESEPWFQVTLTARGCGEWDSDMIGDACAYIAKEIGSEKVMIIYDSLAEADSDLGDWTKDHNLQAGNNCFKIQVHQTTDLIKRYGPSTYYASQLKRVDCGGSQESALPF